MKKGLACKTLTQIFNFNKGHNFIKFIQVLSITWLSDTPENMVTIHQINSFFVYMWINQLQPSFVTLSKRFPGRTPYIIEEILLTFKIIHRKCGVMHYARKNSLCEDGDRPFYHNQARLKLGFNIRYFHSHTRSKYLKWSNQTVAVHPLHIYKEFTPIVTYPMQSGPDVQPFLGKQILWSFKAILWVVTERDMCIW